MQSQQQLSSPGADNSTTPRGPSRQRNNDTNSLSRSVNRLSLSLRTNTSNPRDTSPGPDSPKYPARTAPSPLPLRRSSSTISLKQRAASPAPSQVLGRKSSSSSLRSDIRPGSPRNSVSRRSSFAPSMSASIGAKSPLQPHFEEKLPLRACDIAEDHFRKELARHEGTAGTANAGTIVIVHDQCYGHRYSRPKTPKNVLSFIMERPERILASVLGISTAYVRLGGRHAEGHHPLHPDQNPPERIPFKIRKTSRLVDITSPVVTNVHGTKWMQELKTLCDNAGGKLATTGKELARDPPSMPGQPPKHEFHAGDLYLCQESLNAFQGALGGVLDAVDAVFQGTHMGNGPSRAFVCVRPPGHHCSADFPSGFCWLNNVHVGIEHAMMQYGLTHAAIIDFDLHHGDGSQAITWARNKKVQNMPKGTANKKKTSIGYFSLHDINSYPCEDGDDDKVQAASLCIDNAHGQSIWNVHLQSWKTPEEFWAIYEDKYLVLLDKTRQYLRFHTKRLTTGSNQPVPKAAIFLSAGFDASEWETAGMQRHAVNVPTEFYARFTRDVVRLAEEDGTAVNGRVISVLEGGYSDRALASGVMSHISGLTDGQVWSDPNPANGMTFDMRQRLGGLSMSDEDLPMGIVEADLTPVTYDPSWWDATQLSELENLVNPPLPVAIKKLRQGPQAHFSSPTQSFTAKVVDPTKLAHLQPSRGAPTPPRPITPPPPDVDWATAAHALSALLVPLDRQTRSCRPEELAEPKVKKEKSAAPASNTAKVDPSSRRLRGRKPVTSYADVGSDEDKASLRTESQVSRRRTIADFQLASADPSAAGPVSRRMSVASSVSSIGDRSVSRTSDIPPPAARRRGAVPPLAASADMPVKKNRGTTSSRAPQRPAVPRVPSAYISKVAPVKGKENDDMDALTSGLKRVTLKMPSKEEYEAREKEKEQKDLEAPKKAPAKTAARKAPTNRTTTTKTTAKPATAPAKRGPGRPPKSSKTSSSANSPAPTMTPEPPKLQSAATAPLEQPQPVQAEAEVSSLVDHTDTVSPLQETSFASVTSDFSRRSSGAVIEPPTDIRDSVITPEQLREQLPLPSFVTAEALPVTTPPPRPDTPPPPPPATGLQFVNYTSHSFDTAPPADDAPHTSEPQQSTALHWLPPNTDTAPTPPTLGSPPMLPATKQDLPVFTANSTIPFAMPAPAPIEQEPPLAGNTVDDKNDIWEVPETPAR